MRRWLLWGLLVLVVGGGVGAYALLRGGPGRVPHEPSRPSRSRPAAGETVEAGAAFIFRSYYTRCQREHTSVEPAGPEHAGLDRAALAARFPEWQLRSFARDRVEFYRTTDAPCPEEARWFTITLRDGFVVVLEGRGLRGPVHLVTRIPAAHLTPEEQALLQQGLQVRSPEDVQHVLESLEEAGGSEGR